MIKGNRHCRRDAVHEPPRRDAGAVTVAYRSPAQERPRHGADQQGAGRDEHLGMGEVAMVLDGQQRIAGAADQHVGVGRQAGGKTGADGQPAVLGGRRRGRGPRPPARASKDPWRYPVTVARYTADLSYVDIPFTGLHMNIRKSLLGVSLGILAILVVDNYRSLFGVAPPWPDSFSRGSTSTGSRPSISWSEARKIGLDLDMIKMAYAEYYFTQGNLPRSMKDAGVTPHPYILARNNGTIEVRIDGKPDARIFWRPRPTNIRMEWDCVSPDVGNVGDRFDHCRYDPAYPPDLPVQETFSAQHRILFEFNRAGMDGASERERESLHQFLSRINANKSYHVASVVITGYADPMGPVKLNIRLAEQRAAYVRETVATMGIRRELISVRVIGADPRPIRSCSSSLPREERIDCYAASRRVDIAISGLRDL